MSKKKICMVLAAAVSVCFLVCLVAAVRLWMALGQVPSGMVMLALVTGLCTGMIWKGVREM